MRKTLDFRPEWLLNNIQCPKPETTLFGSRKKKTDEERLKNKTKKCVFSFPSSRTRVGEVKKPPLSRLRVTGKSQSPTFKIFRLFHFSHFSQRPNTVYHKHQNKNKEVSGKKSRSRGLLLISRKNEHGSEEDSPDERNEGHGCTDADTKGRKHGDSKLVV